MTATLPPETGAAGASAEPPLAASRPALAQDWRRLVRMGAVGAVAQVFIALSNMPVRLDERVIVKPVLSLGYLTLLIVPFAAGHRVGHQIKRSVIKAPAVFGSWVNSSLSAIGWSNCSATSCARRIGSFCRAESA